MDSKNIKLSNNIDFVYKQNKNTPRVAFCLNCAITKAEKFAGIYSLMSQLLLQGTKTYSAEALADELDKYAIEFSVDYKQDYLRFKFVALNEDFNKAIELMEDIVKNSTFKEFEKEIAKARGEIMAKLDAPRAKAVDNYYKTMFDGHFYGNTSSKILEVLDRITKEDVIEAYNSIINSSKKVLTFVGDIDFENVKNVIETHFSDLSSCDNLKKEYENPILSEAKKIEETKADLNQAHILKGWLTPSYSHEDYPVLLLLNVILGASGLSSRLFLELRDKKGLAYVVRSSYEPFVDCGNFCIYIATEPKNINVSLEGFEEEIRKIKEIEVGEEELENAKNNLFGKWAFTLETNNQQACSLAHYVINGLGYDFREKLIERVKKVTAQDVQNCANKYFNEISVTSIFRP